MRDAGGRRNRHGEGNDTAERRAEIVSRIPMGRFVETQEIAAMMAFLATDECSFSTGAAFDISGGRATY